jgi:predicted GH43/DUF377 family glycosyl hydrolase
MNSFTQPKWDLLKRYKKNPILTASDWPYPMNIVCNAGATRLEDGTTLLLVRVEDRRGISHLTAARSKDGLTKWRIDEKPTFYPEPEAHPEELWGIEDCRIIYVSELAKYAITYTSYAHGGTNVSLALTTDFKNFERKGVVMPPDDKNAALFPRKFDGRWLMAHRPMGLHNRGHIWFSYSPDLKHWGEHTLVLEARRGGWWDSRKIGLSTPPIETSDGWLLFYHGVRETAGGCIYRVGASLLDLDDPRVVLRRSDEWLFTPVEEYELVGDVQNVVFPCGHTIGDDGDSINLYYGAADTSLAVAQGSVGEIVEWLKTHGRPGGHARDY